MAGNRVVAVALDAMEVSWLDRLTARGDLPKNQLRERRNGVAYAPGTPELTPSAVLGRRLLRD